MARSVFHGEWHTQLIRDGQAALVNAVAYRSVNMNALTDANMKGIPSVRIARNWIKTACAEAAAGRRLVVFQRSRLWGVKGGDRDLSQLLILMDVSVLTVTPTMRVYTWASLCAKPETRYQRLPKAEICPGLGGQGRITHDSVIPRPC